MKNLKETFQLIFSQLQDKDLDMVLFYFEEERIAKNDFFTVENRYCSKLSFQTSGFLRIFKTLENKEVTQWISSPDYFITEISSFFFDEPNRWSTQALTDVTLLTLKKENYKKISEQIPKWNAIEKKFLADCFATLENRVFSHLSLNAEERYELYFDTYRELFNHVPLQHIASVLGMTPETFSRIRNRKAQNS